MDIFAQFTSDVKKEEEGTEIQIGLDAYLTVARAGNKTYARLMQKAQEANKYTLDQKNHESDACAEKIYIDVMARSVLLGWRGVDYQGKPMQYSLENAKILLAIKDFQNLVTRLASDFSRFKAATEAADEKNLSPTPDGAAPGEANTSS